MGNLEMEQDLELDLKLNLDLSFLEQTYQLFAAAILEVCILLVLLFHQRNLHLSEVVVLHWHSSSWLNLWKTDSVD